jgi:hypothetical protein
MGSNEVDIKVIWKDLDAYEKELDKEAKSLQEIWTKICQLHTKTEEEIARCVVLVFVGVNDMSCFHRCLC